MTRWKNRLWKVLLKIIMRLVKSKNALLPKCQRYFISEKKENDDVSLLLLGNRVPQVLSSHVEVT